MHLPTHSLGRLIGVALALAVALTAAAYGNSQPGTGTSAVTAPARARHRPARPLRLRWLPRRAQPPGPGRLPR
jgi:hypothetical protein